jgi:hypothetical protein
MHNSVIDIAVICIAVSLTPRCHCHHCATNFVDYLREFEAIFEKALKGQRHEIFHPRFFFIKLYLWVP